MARLKGGNPQLDPNEVLRFFDSRARRASPEDHYAVTTFTDRSTAEERHLAEIGLALPLLGLPHPAAHVLDIGCGGGRWARSLAGNGQVGIAAYHGIDFSPALIDLARAQGLPPSFTFEVMSIDAFANGALRHEHAWTHILAIAVSIYLNDELVCAMLHRAAGLLPPGGKLYLREGVVTQGDRLTLVEEPSEALQDRYSVVYRTASEYENLIAGAGLAIFDSGRLPGPHFARHAETVHQYFICGRP
jgi:SAM-dependent methyltransferase